jgi:spore maturation protein CgeB
MNVLGVDYQFVACGDVFTAGLAHAAATLGIDYGHVDWSADVPAVVRARHPDLVLVVHGRKFCQRHGRITGARSAVWLLDEPYEVDDTAAWSSRFEYVFVNDASTLGRHHGRATVVPVCFDPSVHTPRAGAPHYRVGFIGGSNPTRERLLAELAARDVLDYVVGGPWATASLVARCRAGRVPPAVTAALYQQTAIVINVFRDRHHYNRLAHEPTALNPRVYEALACGALVISEWRPEIDVVVPELPTFRSADACADLVAHYLADPADARRVQGICADRLAGHTYAARLRAMLAAAGIYTDRAA